MYHFELNWGSREEPTHRNGAVSSRITHIEADRYEVVPSNENYYRIDFFVGDEVIMSCFEIPDTIRRHDSPGISQ